MTYEYYKENYKKLTKTEINSNKEFQQKFLEEKHQELIQKTKDEMDQRLTDYIENMSEGNNK